MMKLLKSPLLVILFFAGMVCSVFAQPQGVAGGEVTAGWDHRDAFLIPEAGLIPPRANFDQDIYLLRGRLQNFIGHPMVEIAYRDYRYNIDSKEYNDIRGAVLRPVSMGKNSFIKLLGLRQNPSVGDAFTAFSGYGMTRLFDFNIAAGVDYAKQGSFDNQIYSLRSKRNISRVTLFAGYSHEVEGYDRYGGGAMYRLPVNLLAGGEIFDWDGEAAYALNLGRFTDIRERTDPSFSINYLDIPTRYRWTNFRIMWGRPGINYVPPTFENPVFSGQYDIDLALLLNELMPDNFRHYDSPLLYRRYDEYGLYTVRVNHIKTAGGLTRFDANLSYAPGLQLGALSRPHVTVTYDRTKMPVFGQQPDRYWLDLGIYLYKFAYFGVSFVSDLEDYQQVLGEIRYQVPFK